MVLVARRPVYEVPLCDVSLVTGRVLRGHYTIKNLAESLHYASFLQVFSL